jgi:hypothetical protein
MEANGLEFIWPDTPASPRAKALARALASRLASVAPDGISVSAREDRVIVCAQGDLECGSGSIIDASDDRPLAAKITATILSTLSTVQDYISESLTEQWPRSPSGSMALPGARCDGAHAHLWFGDEHSPTIALLPIDIAALDRGE